MNNNDLDSDEIKYKNKMIALRLSDNLHEKLAYAATKNQTDVSKIIRAILAKFFNL